MGYPTSFIRLTGCPLRCTYCDTAYAFTGGEKLTIDNILQKIADHQSKYITVTGGEPLAQPNCLKLLTALCDKNYRVSLETSGAMLIDTVDPRVIKILDIKTPDSKMLEYNKLENLKFLNPIDETKFVICSRDDYNWAKDFIKKYCNQLPNILFSPSHDQLSNRDLADWIIEDNLPVRFQLQLHKYIWGDEKGR